MYSMPWPTKVSTQYTFFTTLSTCVITFRELCTCTKVTLFYALQDPVIYYGLPWFEFPKMNDYTLVQAKFHFIPWLTFPVDLDPAVPSVTLQCVPYHQLWCHLLTYYSCHLHSHPNRQYTRQTAKPPVPIAVTNHFLLPSYLKIRQFSHLPSLVSS